MKASGRESLKSEVQKENDYRAEGNKTLESYQEVLLPYIDIPYFRNNPKYLGQWRRYYLETKDPQILLLMYHKEIGTLHHWIFIQFAEYFKSVNKVELSHFILTEAIKNRVYNQKVLQDALDRLPTFESQYNKGDMLAVLNQKNIQALGRVWNKFEEVLYVDEHLEKEFCDFGIKQMIQFEINEGRELQDFITLPLNNHITKVCNDDLFLEDIKFCSYNPEESNENACKVPITKKQKVSARIEVNGEINVSGFIYIKREVEEEWFSAMKIAEDTNIGDTVASSLVCFHKIDTSTINYLQKISQNEYTEINGDVYVLFNCDMICFLEKALSIADETVCCFYLAQIITILQEYARKGLSLCKYKFFVDENFCVFPFGYALEAFTGEEKSKETLRCIFPSLSTLLSEDYETICKLCHTKLSTEEAKSAILRHKTRVLDLL